MSGPETYWSAQARQEFDTIFDGAPVSMRFKTMVAQALNHGWSNNRDKPLWAMAVLVAALAEACRSRGTADKHDGLDIICHPAGTLWHTLNAWAADEALSPTPLARVADGKVVVITGGTSLAISRARLEILRKLAEFLLVCNGFAFAPELIAAFRGLAQRGLADPHRIGETSRLLSRLAYKYRTEHFRDGHATSAFAILMQFLSNRPRFEIDDDSVLQFWGWPRNDKYKTYATSFYAFVDFHDALADIAEARRLASAVSIDEPHIAATLRDIEDIAAIDTETETGDAETDDAGSIAGDDAALEPGEIVAALANGTGRLLAQKNLRFLDQLVSLRAFGFEHVLASLRLISFHPVQSGLSNSLRTGRSKLSLEDRLTCTEAITYLRILEMSQALEQQLVELLKVAVIQRAGSEADGDNRIAQLRRNGTAMHGIEGSPLERDQWQRLEPALLAGHRVARTFHEAVVRRFGRDFAGLELSFAADRDQFSRMLTARYALRPGSAESQSTA